MIDLVSRFQYKKFVILDFKLSMSNATHFSRFVFFASADLFFARAVFSTQRAKKAKSSVNSASKNFGYDHITLVHRIPSDLRSKAALSRGSTNV